MKLQQRDSYYLQYVSKLRNEENCFSGYPSFIRHCLFSWSVFSIHALWMRIFTLSPQVFFSLCMFFVSRMAYRGDAPQSCIATNTAARFAAELWETTIMLDCGWTKTRTRPAARSWVIKRTDKFKSYVDKKGYCFSL